MEGLNIKQVCKQIKAAKLRIIWWRNNNQYYITNQHWIIRLPVDQIPREILIQLFSIFAEIPDEGRILNSWRGSVSSIAEITQAVDGAVYGHMKKAVMGKITPLVKVSDTDNPDLRIIHYKGKDNKDQIIYVNDEYIRMADIKREPVYCTGKHSPVFFLDGSFAVLPVWNNFEKNEEEAELLNNKLIAATMVNAATAID